MLEIILMLLGLAFPNSNANTTTNDSQTPQTEISTPSGDTNTEYIDPVDPGETGGNNGQNPPKNP